MAKANPFYAYNRAVETKSPQEQIVALYLAAISYMQRAKEAAKEENHDERYQMVDKTLSIVRGLRACLDFGANEQVALALNQYYEALEEMLAALQIKDDKLRSYDDVIHNLRLVQTAWEEINLVVTPKVVEATSEDGDSEGQDLLV
jgi:flagellar biosynthetic protein FliS